jgi:hypothetical protein
MDYDIHLGFPAKRRTFLKILASLAVTTGAGLAGCARDLGSVPPGLAFLDDTTYWIVKAFSERILPPGGPIPEGAGDLDVVPYFDSIVASQPPEIRKDMKSGILLLEYRALLFRFSFKRFTEMPPDMQDQYLKSWETSSIALFRGIFWGYKKICCLGFFSNEKVWPYIGYDGRWI